jgi:hypothetical protein
VQAHIHISMLNFIVFLIQLMIGLAALRVLAGLIGPDNVAGRALAFVS